MMHLLRIFMFCLLALPVTALELFAAEVTLCSEDIAKFCPQVQTGGGRLVTCLTGHLQELSPACREYQKALQWKTRKAYPECWDDVEQFCQDVTPADRHIIRCLLQHKTELSGECRDKLDAEK